MPLGTAILGSAAISGLGSIASGIIGSSASQKAAQTQSQTATMNAVLEATMYNQNVGRLQPFVSAGTNAASELSNLTGTNTGGNPLTAPLTAAFNPTMAQLSATPGYQFTLGQGQLAAQNGYAAQGLSSSGAALKGATNYAENLAATTYQQQFQNYWTNNLNAAGLLQNQTGLGENAAAQVGNMGTTTAGQIANSTSQGAAASAAGTIGSANALTGAIGGVSGAANNAALMLAMNNSGLFGQTGAGSASTGDFSGSMANALYPSVANP